MGKFLELTITTKYVPNWGWWEVLREFIQNALDSHDAGYPMEIRRNPNGTVVISNKGAYLSKQTLLLGATTKDGGGSRGKFGEGYKLAMMVACRIAKNSGSDEPPIRIKTGDEIWRPVLKWSDQFEAELLQVEVNPAKGDGNLTVYIPNVTEEIWKMVEDRVLAMNSALKVQLPNGEILMDAKNKGQLFVKGLWISPLPNVSFGYNLFNVDIDRDRRIAEHWSLRGELSRLLESALLQGKLATSKIAEFLSNDNCLEAEALMNYSEDSNFVDKIVEAWKKENGDEAVPVFGIEQAAQVVAAGKKPVIVSKSLFSILRKGNVANFDKIKSEIRYNTSKVYQADEIPTEKMEAMLLAVRSINDALGESNDLEIVDFLNKEILGTCQGSTIKIARSECDSLERFLDVLLHELGHRNGAKDLTAAHVDQVTKDAAQIIKYLLHLD